MDEKFVALRDGDPEPMVEWMQQQFEDEIVNNRPLAIADLYESAFRLFFLLKLRGAAPDGWVIDHEVEVEGSWRRADIVLTDPDGAKIMIELKYIQSGDVYYEGRAQDKWKPRVNNGYDTIVAADDPLTLRYQPAYKKKMQMVLDSITKQELEIDEKYGQIKFDETKKAHEIDQAYIIIGIGPRIVHMPTE
jgi:hypothetical protein